MPLVIDYKNRYEQLKWLLTIQEQLLLGSKTGEKSVQFTVDQFEEWLPEDFFNKYYYRDNKPVMFKGVASKLFKKQAFNWADFRQQFGHFPLKAKKNIEQQVFGFDYEHDLTTVSRFVEHIQTTKYPDYYATAYDGDKHREFINAFLSESLLELPNYLDKNTLYQDVYPWVGPANTITRTHIDMKNGLLVQLIGTKRVWLFPYFYYHAMYPKDRFFTSVDFINPDSEKHPEFFNTHGVELLLEPGDAVFLPVTWWHRVHALEPSLSVSFFNFKYPNTFLAFEDSVRQVIPQ